MAENDKGLGSKFLGLFVEREGQSKGEAEADADAEKTPAEVVAELARKSGAPHPAAAPHAGAGARWRALPLHSRRPRTSSSTR